MTEKLPNFKAVTLDEVIEHAHPAVGQWVKETNEARAKAQIEYEAATIEVAGVTLAPGDCVNLTFKTRYRGDKERRKLNCVIVGQAVSRSSYAGARRILSFRRYGAKPGGWVQGDSIIIEYITKVEKVTTPDWIIKEEAERKERGW